VIHNEDTPMNAWVMTTVTPGKPGPQLKEAKGGGPTNCNPQPGDGGNIVLVCVNVTMTVLGQLLRQNDPNQFNSPVTAIAGPEGRWEFQVTITNTGAPSAAGNNATAAREIFEKQLGIKLEQQKRSISTLVVDSVNRKPTDNLPGIEKLVPVVP